MIHIATVHYETDIWIDIQLRYIAKHITEPYRVYAVLNRIHENQFKKFYFATDHNPPNLYGSDSHAAKLNYLASQIMPQAKDEDMLIFIDGDAFPISRHTLPFIKEKIAKHKLAAIRRDETLTDFQAHPSFCVTTAGLWKEIGGDWKLGFLWKDVHGENVTDTGAELLRRLREHKVDWFPMLRSNRKNWHPLFFGVYSNIVYHNGCGFRGALCQLDRKTFPFKQMQVLANYQKDSQSWFNKAVRATGESLKNMWRRRLSGLKDRIYDEILADEDFYLRFITRPENRPR